MMLEFKDKSFENFWRNLMRYMVDGVRQPVEVATERTFYGPEEAVRIRAEVADEKYLNLPNAVAMAHVTSPSGKTVDVELKPTTEGGFEGYDAPFRPDEEGTYRIEVTPTRRGTDAKQGLPLRIAKTSFIVGPLNREARNAAQNQELLKRLASDTNGHYYSASNVSNLVEDLTHNDSAGAVRETKELWDMPINFLLVIGLVAGEWFIRKRKGLA